MRIKLQQNLLCHVGYAYRQKHFMPLHKQEKKVFIFPNTSIHSLHLPSGYKVCIAIESFKIKSLKGGFQRRPELIAQCGMNNRNIELTRNVHEFLKPKALHIQLELAEMALHLIDLFRPPKGQQLNETNITNKHEIPASHIITSPPTKFALDIGCGMGVSLIPLVNNAYTCIGVDLNMQCLTYLKYKNQNNICCYQSPSMPLSLFNKTLSFSENVDVIRWDLRHGLPFRENIFDLSISISFLQWLFYGQRSQQLSLFFSDLYKVLRPGGRCVIQFYPRSPKQLSDAVSHAASYFEGALVGDYPHIDRGRKLFLLLYK